MIDLIKNREEAMEVQRKLAAFGLYAGELDGRFGPKSKAALAAWRVQVIPTSVGTDEYGFMQSQVKFVWPSGRSEFTSYYGGFMYRSHESGLVQVLDDWGHKNLVTKEFPFFGRLAVHKRVANSLHRVGIAIVSKSLGYPIRLVGCYNPRHKGYNPGRTLSSHAFAAAVDLNWDTNGYGTVGDMPPEIVQAFQDEGWTWGGEWGGLRWDKTHKAWMAQAGRLVRSDPMHFQAGRDW